MTLAKDIWPPSQFGIESQGRHWLNHYAKFCKNSAKDIIDYVNDENVIIIAYIFEDFLIPFLNMFFCR